MAGWVLEALLAGSCAGSVVALARAVLPRPASAALRHDGHLAVILAALFGAALGPWLPGLDLPCLPLRPAAPGAAAGHGGGSLWSAGWWAVHSIPAAVLLGRRLAAEWALLGLARGVEPLESREWRQLLGEEQRRAGVGRGVRLGSSPGICGGVSFGVLRPVVLLAAEAREGPNDRWRAVLVHELAHVRRLDVLASWAADLASALFWFLPWIPHSARCMRFERELACDDAVVARGGRPSGYASLLLNLLRERQRGLLPGGSPRPLPWSGVAAAADTAVGLEARIAALLAPREEELLRPRNADGPEARQWCLAAALSVALLCAGIRLVPQGEGPRRPVPAPAPSTTAARAVAVGAPPLTVDSPGKERVREPPTTSPGARTGPVEPPSPGAGAASDSAPPATPIPTPADAGADAGVPRGAPGPLPRIRFAVAAPGSLGLSADRELAAILGVPEAGEALSSLRLSAANRRGGAGLSLVVLAGSLRLRTREP